MPLSDVLDQDSPLDYQPPPLAAPDEGAPMPTPAASVPGPQSRADLSYSPANAGYAPATEPRPASPAGVGAYGAGSSAPSGQPAGFDATDQAIAAYRPPQAQARPDGFVPKSQTVETSPVAPGAQQALDDLESARAEQAAAQQNYNAEAGAALAPLQKRQMAEQQALQQNIHSSLQEHADKIAQLTENASKAAHEEPESFWGKNLGTHILRTLGMAAMAFGHGLNPNAPNPMEYMNNMIKENAEKQRTKVEAAKGDLSREQNLYALMKEKFGDDQSAMTATQMLQKQAVLDQLDEHFQAPVTAPKTWGGGDTNDDSRGSDPFSALPPTARLGLANARLALAQDIAKDQLELDKAHVTKLTSSQEYKAATGAGGAPDPLAVLRRVAEGRELRGKIETAIPGAEAGLAKEQAGTEATLAKAEADRAKSPAAKATNFEQMAGELGSTSLWEHPVDSIMQNFQGTTGQQKELNRNAYNERVMGAIASSIPGIVRNRELYDKATKTYQIQPNDTEQTIRRKVNLARQNLISGQAAEGGTTGATVDVTGDEQP